jgi:Patatin-like phospholipase
MRGLFQAAFLAQLESRLDSPLSEHFDLIAATSTGALIGLGLASGKRAGEIERLYVDHGPAIFDGKSFGQVRRGPIYSQASLRRLLERILGSTTQMRQLESQVLICASGLDDFKGKIFSNRDADMLAVDVALASAAAPMYFAPVTPPPASASYMDGGLWANDPSYVAVVEALRDEEIARNRIEVLSIGTGRRASGMTGREVERLRPASLDFVRFIIEYSTSLQAWLAGNVTRSLLAPGSFREINPQLPVPIALDDAGAAIERLPGLAKSTFDEEGEALVRWLLDERQDLPTENGFDLPEPLRIGLEAANLKRFIPSRRFYEPLRGGRGSIAEYVVTANRSLTMVSINLATGVDMEQIQDTLAKMILERERPVAIAVSMLDPNEAHLMQTVAPVLGRTPTNMAQRVVDSLESLTGFHDSLPNWAQNYFRLSCHNVLPHASSIAIDEDTPEGVIQLETKPYDASFQNSFALEIGHGSELFETLITSYNKLAFGGRLIAGCDDPRRNL